jgi:hypothetical protein
VSQYWPLTLVVLGGCEALFGLAEVGPATDAAPDSPPPDAAWEMVEVAIQASSDDALENPNGTTLTTYGWISLYSPDHWGGLRFEVPTIERGATIHHARLEVFVDSPDEDSPDLAIHTEVSASPAPFTPTPVGQPGTHDVSQRSRSTARVAWVMEDIGAGYRQSPPITALVAERVAATDWTAGAAIVFVFDALGTSLFEIRQYDRENGLYAAKLFVQFTNP